MRQQSCILLDACIRSLFIATLTAVNRMELIYMYLVSIMMLCVRKRVQYFRSHDLSRGLFTKRVWASNHMNILQREEITQPYPKFNGALFKRQSQLGHLTGKAVILIKCSSPFAPEVVNMQPITNISSK